ncbi:hypothetical protein DFH09DRAFT_1301700 [Mycena vulgaris]|nr:hypothetical protein DFH09DRAFT_1301700 [Mycena vulgaris]
MLGARHPRDSTQPPALAMHPGFPPCSAALVCPSPSHFVRNHAPPVHYGEVDPRSLHNTCVTASPVPPLPARGPVTVLPHLRAAASFSGPSALDTAQQDRDVGDIALGRLVPVVRPALAAALARLPADLDVSGSPSSTYLLLSLIAWYLKPTENPS